MSQSLTCINKKPHSLIISRQASQAMTRKEKPFVADKEHLIITEDM